GAFDFIGGQSRNNFAALSISTGLATAWDPAADVTVASVAIWDSNIYAGGMFENIGGQARHCLAELESASGLATAWNHDPFSPDLFYNQLFVIVYAIAIADEGNTVYVGGQTVYPYGNPRGNFSQYSTMYDIEFQTDGLAGASLDGPTTQIVAYGANGRPVTAIAPEGYHLAEWTWEGVTYSTDNPITVTGVTRDMVLVGHFTTNTYTLNYLATAHGIISGFNTQTVQHGSDGTTVTAQPATGYRFVQWSDGSTKNPRQDVAVTTNITVTAEFALRKFVVSFKTDGTLGASLDGETSQTVSYGASCSPVTAMAFHPYKFDRWTVRGVAYSTSNPLTVTSVTQSMTLTANFIIGTLTHTVTFQTDGTASASISGATSQTVGHGADCEQVTAVAPLGYQFTRWTLNGKAYSSNNPLTVTDVIANMNIVAEFTSDAMTHTVIFLLDGTPGASLEGVTTQSVANGSEGTTVTAKAPAGYHFVKWTQGGGADYSTANPLQVTNVTEDLILTANFAGNIYTVVFQTDGTAGATLDGPTSQAIAHGANGEAVTARPPKGRSFQKWTLDGELYSADNPLTVTNVTQNMTLVAVFGIGLPVYTVTFQTDDTASASLAGDLSQMVEQGEDCTTVTAIAPAHHHFVHWMNGRTAYSDANPLVVSNVTSNMTLKASFALDTYTLNYEAGASGSISGDTPQTVGYGDNGTTVVAMPDVGYHFVRWSDGSTDNLRMDSAVTSDITVTATFAIDIFTLRYAAGANGSIAGQTSQTIAYGDNGTTVTAVPDITYHFVQWSDGSTDNPRADNAVTTDISVTAQFAIGNYTVVFQTDGTPGAFLDGATTQMVAHGADCAPVTANAPEGFHFVKWTNDGADYSISNPLTLTNIMKDMTLTAVFKSNELGSLVVMIHPQGAIDAEAQWRRVGTSLWRNSGEIESDISTGSQTVEFKTITGWNTPLNSNVMIYKDQTSTLSCVYVNAVKLQRIRDYLLGNSLDNTSLDFNSDGKIDIADLIRLINVGD
ncbi:MAG: InlB B-repeat-containing protein, partial [Candidatus Sumerlaeota bacterium]|nr:InlB B-repeat-containing protein [Candidatus Sumerlaeota bacterium]